MMKTYLKLRNISTTMALIAGLWMVLLASCSKDLGNYDYSDPNTIGIQSTADSFNVRQNDTLNIEVTHTQTQGSNELSYIWYLIQYEATAGNPPVFVLDSTKNLKVQIIVVPGLYKIVNKVTDRQTGVSFYKYFILNVQPAPWGGEGWLVLQDQSASQNGNDFSIILSKDGTTHGITYHNLYQQANQRKLPLGTNYMAVMNYNHSLRRQKVMFAYPGGGVEVKAIDYSDSSYAQNWFLNEPSPLKVEYNGVVSGGQREVMINNGQVFIRSVNATSVRTPPILFGAPYFGTWELAPFALRYASGVDHYIGLYDKKNRCFFVLNGETNVLVPNRPDIANQHFIPYSGSPSALLPGGTGYDYNDLRHNLIAAHNLNQVVSAPSGTPGTWNCFFRNDAADSTWLIQIPVHIAMPNSNVSGRYYLNPVRCPGINQATLFANPKFLATPGVFYYANQHQVFTCTVSTTQGNSQAVSGYNFPTGTIIRDMKVFESGYSGPNTTPRTPFPATEGRVLVVATDETANGGGHNVYFININNNGTLQTTYADKYTGFDKIISLQFKKDVNL